MKKADENKRKIIALMKNSITVLLALIMILGIKVTDVEAATYGMADLGWSEDELDWNAAQMIDETKTQTSEDGNTTTYYNSAGRMVKIVSVRPNLPSVVNITYYDPSNNNAGNAIGCKQITCSSFGGGSEWICIYNAYDSENPGSQGSNRLKAYKVTLSSDTLTKVDNFSVNFTNGTKVIEQTDYFVPNIKRSNGSELIHFKKSETYAVADGVETLTETTLTQNKAIDQSGDNEELKTSCITTTFPEGGEKNVCYEFFDNDGDTLKTKVTETLEPVAQGDGGARYVVTDRITECYENGTLSRRVDDDFMPGVSVKISSTTTFSAEGDVTGNETAVAEPVKSQDYYGQTLYTAVFTVESDGASAGTVITTFDENGGLIEEEYESAGILRGSVARDNDGNIVKYEVIDELSGSETERIFKDALSGRKSRSIRSEDLVAESAVHVTETDYDEDVNTIRMIDTIIRNGVIFNRVTFRKDGPEITLSTTEEKFDDQGNLIGREEKAMDGDNYVAEVFDGSGVLIRRITYERYTSGDISEYTDIILLDTDGNITGEKIKTEYWTDGYIYFKELEWFYDENHERSYGVEKLQDYRYNLISERKVDPQGNEIDKPVPITVSLSATSFTYTGTEIKPAVQVLTGETQIDPTEYTISYENNIETGTATIIVTDVWGRTYKVDGSATFEITRAPISPKVEMEDWTVGTSASVPTISGNSGGGTITIEYKEKEADDECYTGTVPETAGQYTIRVSIAETKNYRAGVATADFTVKAAETNDQGQDITIVDNTIPVKDTDPGTGTASGQTTDTGPKTTPSDSSPSQKSSVVEKDGSRITSERVTKKDGSFSETTVTVGPDGKTKSIVVVENNGKKDTQKISYKIAGAKATVSGVKISKGSATIPSKIIGIDKKQYTVTKLGKAAFKGQKLKKLTVSKTVKVIEANALDNTGLKTLILNGKNTKLRKNSLRKTSKKLVIKVKTKAEKRNIEKQLKKAGNPKARVKVD